MGVHCAIGGGERDTAWEAQENEMNPLIGLTDREKYFHPCTELTTIR